MSEPKIDDAAAWPREVADLCAAMLAAGSWRQGSGRTPRFAAGQARLARECERRDPGECERRDLDAEKPGVRFTRSEQLPGWLPLGVAILPLPDGQQVEIGLMCFEEGWDVIFSQCPALREAIQKGRGAGIAMHRNVVRAVVAWQESSPNGPTNDGRGWAPPIYL